MDWTTAMWANGPQLYNWLEQEGELERARMTNDRRLRGWRRGAYASLQAVDYLMIRLGRHISELPEYVWVTQCRRGHPYTEANTIYKIGRHGNAHLECRACKKAAA